MNQRSLVAAGVAAAALVVVACASTKTVREEKQRYESLVQAELNRQKHSIDVLTTSLDECRAKLSIPETVSIIECHTKLESCQALANESERRAHAEGRLAVWQSLAITGTPRVDGLVFKDHFMTVQVTIRGQPVYTYTVRTDGLQAPFKDTLSVVADAGTVAKLLAAL